ANIVFWLSLLLLVRFYWVGIHKNLYGILALTSAPDSAKLPSERCDQIWWVYLAVALPLLSWVFLPVVQVKACNCQSSSYSIIGIGDICGLFRNLLSSSRPLQRYHGFVSPARRLSVRRTLKY